MLNRRLFLSALLCAPATVFAAEDGFLGDILGGIADRALRDYVGQHLETPAGTAGTTTTTTTATPATNGAAISKSATVGSETAVFAVFVTTMTMIDRFSCGREVESLPCAHVP